MTGFFGWELLYSSVENDIKSSQDILVCLAHLVLVSNGFKCIGLGTSKIMDGSRRREGLPKGWNAQYAIKYVYQGHLYIFKATSLDEGVMLNLERANKNMTSLVQLKTNSVVRKTGSLSEMIPNYKNVIDVVKKQLFEKVVGFRKFREVSSQTMEFAPYFPSYDLVKGPCFDPIQEDIKLLFKERANHLKI